MSSRDAAQPAALFQHFVSLLANRHLQFLVSPRHGVWLVSSSSGRMPAHGRGHLHMELMVEGIYTRNSSSLHFLWGHNPWLCGSGALRPEASSSDVAMVMPNPIVVHECLHSFLRAVVACSDLIKWFYCLLDLPPIGTTVLTTVVNQPFLSHHSLVSFRLVSLDFGVTAFWFWIWWIPISLVWLTNGVASPLASVSIDLVVDLII